MGQKIAITQTLQCSTVGHAELPDNRTWEDVSGYYVKWDKLNLVYKDGTTGEIDLESETMDVIDWKRPITTEVWSTNDDGTPNISSNPLATQE